MVWLTDVLSARTCEVMEMNVDIETEECIQCHNSARFEVKLELRTSDPAMAHELAEIATDTSWPLHVTSVMGDYLKRTDMRLNTFVSWFVPTPLSYSLPACEVESEGVLVCGKHLVQVVTAMQRVALVMTNDICKGQALGWRNLDILDFIWHYGDEELTASSADGRVKHKIVIKELE